MFLKRLIKTNPQLVEAAFEYHRKGLINPNTYILDLDTVVENTKALLYAAEKNSINLYMMTKQIGRNPLVAKKIAEAGMDKAVVVDPWEALTLGKAGIKIGNVGHLVQIPSNMLEEIIKLSPEVITVFSLEKAKEVSQVSKKLGVVSKLLLRVVGPDDMLYEGQVGGFKEGEIVRYAKEIQKLPNVEIEGITAFPCLLFNYEKEIVKPMENAMTLQRVRKILKEELNLEINQINIPSVTSVETMELLNKLGATHGEPGHSITGTTPANGYREQKEKIAMVYVTEVSHLYGGNAYIYGGGFYPRGRLKGAIVGSKYDELINNYLKGEENSPESIDYYGTLKIGHGKAKVGDTALYSFRTQIFVTRSNVAVVEGIQKGKPNLLGIYDNLGKKLI